MSSMCESQATAKDRISELPNPVLSHILSFLSTKDAVRTSVLSARWKNIWASVPILDFDDFTWPPSPAGFVEFVDRVLFFRDRSDIQKLCLRCSDVDDFSHIDGWIRTAIKRDVVELQLSVASDDEEDHIFELPRCLFTSKTLTVLKLMTSFVINVPTSGCFPSLKFLHVTFNYRPDEDSMKKLFSHCPALEDLTIDGNIGKDVFNFNISMPELKRLRISLSTSYDPNAAYTFYINTPKLEKLDLEESVLSKYIFKNTKSLVEANIYLYFHYEDDEPNGYVNRATKFLAGISHVIYLSLSTHVFEFCSLPNFNNLSKLRMVLHICCYRWEMLTKLLKRSPNLECLILEHEKQAANDVEEHSESEFDECDEYLLYKKNFEGYLEQKYSGHEEYSEHQWSPPEFVPICLLSNLKTISIMGFRGQPDEMEVAKYLLKNGEVLKKMTICIGNCRRTDEELYKEFLMFERGSKTCQVIIKKQF